MVLCSLMQAGRQRLFCSQDYPRNSHVSSSLFMYLFICLHVVYFLFTSQLGRTELFGDC